MNLVIPLPSLSTVLAFGAGVVVTLIVLMVLMSWSYSKSSWGSF